MNRPDGKWFGLFGNIDGGVVKNLHIVEANVSGDSHFGILTGSFAHGVIDGVSVSGHLNLQRKNIIQIIWDRDSKSGGLVGYVRNGNGTIRNSWAKVEVNAENRMQVGGLVGYHRGRGNTEAIPLIENCYSISTINGGYSKVGILVGDNDGGIIRNSYGVGNGRVVGYNYENPIQQNVFCDAEVFSGCAAYGGISGRMTNEMKDSEIFENSGWTSPPWIFGGDEYPRLMVLTSLDFLITRSISHVRYDTYNVRLDLSKINRESLPEGEVILITDLLPLGASFVSSNPERWPREYYYSASLDDLYVWLFTKSEPIEFGNTVVSEVMPEEILYQITASSGELLGKWAKYINEYDEDIGGELEL